MCCGNTGQPALGQEHPRTQGQDLLARGRHAHSIRHTTIGSHCSANNCIAIPATCSVAMAIVVDAMTGNGTKVLAAITQSRLLVADGGKRFAHARRVAARFFLVDITAASLVHYTRTTPLCNLFTLSSCPCGLPVICLPGQSVLALRLPGFAGIRRYSIVQSLPKSFSCQEQEKEPCAIK
jgi:hypothetical protein